MKYHRQLPQLLIIAAPLAIFIFLFLKDTAPSGIFSVHYTVGDRSPYVERFLPDTRVIGERVVDEPAYASVHLPGDFDTLNASLTFQNTLQPIIELGVLVNDAPLQYELQPIQNRIIDESEWSRIDENGVVLLQRAKIYNTLEDFFSAPPDRDTIATYHYDLAEPYRIPDYVAQNALTSTNVSLRGYHEYLTYIKNEPLMIQTDVTGDGLTILVFNERDELVAEEAATGTTVTLVKDDLPEGVYKVILSAESDVVVTRLTTRQRYMSFVGPVSFGDQNALGFWTDSKHLSFYADGADAAHEVFIGSGTLTLPEAQVRYDYDVPDAGAVQVRAGAGGFTVTQENMLAFPSLQLFNPYPTELRWNTDLDALGINFILARYTSPIVDGAWTTATASFDLHQAMKKDNDIKLVLSAPGIKSLQSSFDIHALDLEFVRPPRSFKQILQSLKSYVHL